MGSALVTDSFGEARWMGVLENTRSLGDFKYKPFGITPEPEVRQKLLKGTFNPPFLPVYVYFFEHGVVAQARNIRTLS